MFHYSRKNRIFYPIQNDRRSQLDLSDILEFLPAPEQVGEAEDGFNNLSASP